MWSDDEGERINPRISFRVVPVKRDFEIEFGQEAVFEREHGQEDTKDDSRRTNDT